MSQQRSRQDHDQDQVLVGAALRAEAEQYQPDRAAILARIERGQFSGAPVRGRRRRSSRSGLRLAGIVMASAVGFGLSVAGTWAAVGEFSGPKPSEPVVAVTTPSAVGTAEATPSPSTPPSPTTPAGSSSAGSSSPSAAAGATRAQQGFLWSDGSIDPHSTSSWSQSDITLKNHYTVTALDVTVTLADTPGLSSTGVWSSVPAADLDMTVTHRDGTLVYEFRLKPGATLAPGTYVFAGQYNHAAGGRDAGQDTYRATATGHGSPVEVYGNFAATH
ncbi:hypothetical protein [Streptacidiphilus carbonis]|uniref:hypothetical protein n=1 Tax=Streptacidiphilus carbonis TaxID=105422 RepID=UPI0005A74E61|nr:hypothetical protein [Streptacidiphilus carbonis]